MALGQYTDGQTEPLTLSGQTHKIGLFVSLSELSELCIYNYFTASTPNMTFKND